MESLGGAHDESAMVPLADFANHENVDVTYAYTFPGETIEKNEESSKEGSSENSSGYSSDDEAKVYIWRVVVGQRITDWVG